MSEEEFGFELVHLIARTADAARVTGGKCNTCVVTHREIAAIMKAMSMYVRYVDRHLGNGIILRGVSIYGVDVFALASCPRGRLTIGGPELLA